MPKQKSKTKFKAFSKYDFVKSFIAITKNQVTQEEKLKEAEIIADAIEETAELKPFNRNKFIKLHITTSNETNKELKIKQAILIADALKWRQEIVLNCYYNQPLALS
jgi:hypothetical protein